MIITMCGTAGSGKSTIAKLLAKRLGFKHYSMGELQREIAEEKKISLLELGKIEEEDPSLDSEVDQRQGELGRREDNFVIDSRLGYHFIPHSVKVYLDADFEVRAKRILADTIRKELNINLETTKENISKRESSEKKRYKKYYNQNPWDKSNYDLIVDTSSVSPKEIVDEIIHYIEKFNKRK